MDFEGQYLTYEDYIQLGGTLDLMSFNLLEFEARRKIDIRTQNRLKSLTYEEIPEEVKLCEFQLVKSINDYSKSISTTSQSGNISSESIDGYSVTYASDNSTNTIIESKNTTLEDIIKDYLSLVVVNGEHIIYAGIK